MSGQPSRHPQNPAFGYEFYPDQYTDQRRDTQQSNNSPLLNNQESRYLHSFYHAADAGVDFSTLDQTQQNDSFNFLTDVPPPALRAIDTTTSMAGHTPVAQFNPQMAMQNMAGLTYNAHGGSDMPLGIVNGDLLNAASILSQSQMHGQSAHHQHMHPQSANPLHGMHVQSHQAGFQPQPQQHVERPSTSGSMQPIHTQGGLAEIGSPPTALPNMPPPANMLTHVNQLIHNIPRLDTSSAAASVSPFAVPQTAPAGGSHPMHNPRLYQFGSDSNFDQNHFRTPFDSERHEVREHLLTEELYRLKPINRTPTATRDPSPEHAAGNDRKRRMSYPASPGANNNQGTEEPGNQRNKRVRAEGPSSSNTNSSSSATVAPPTRTTGRSRRDSAPAQHTGGRSQRRRTSPGNGGSSRQRRENLNEEQKRQNHIQSEQKRRSQIKGGFEELPKFVPELRDAGFSKSQVLQEVGSFIEKLVDFNQQLRQRLGLPEKSNKN
jgi:helix-loop-helix DNA-binding protein